MTSKPVVGRVSVDLGQKMTFKLHTLLIKFLYWTSDQKAIKLDDVGHIHCESSGSTHLPIGFQLGFSWNF